MSGTPNIQLIWNLFIYRRPVNHLYFVFLPPTGQSRGFRERRGLFWGKEKKKKSLTPSLKQRRNARFFPPNGLVIICET